MTEAAHSLTALMQPYADRAGGLIKALHAVQEEIGHLPAETETAAADVFNLSRAEVKGVISFYADFHREPKGDVVIRVCAAEACQAAGGRALCAALEKKLSLKLGETSAEKDLTLEPVYCLGLCSAAPAAMVGDRLVARASAENVERALERARRERE
ncbi:MAG TPA: NAD(P)H-dependent oxidoreductase subunit E [Parvularculaceae bacterium]|nr:NAD(P)H-dependent oxidoreductase subunit E [Amphiplicatus sp.]HPE30281.1 NAD(P)H-dependent oxidoreductase subunit E [Parvularculaceae bacterium]HRX38230.1 NAD(P)H-dependent oxidoreductase subunit E [Parvularculaceae bacterium]